MGDDGTDLDDLVGRIRAAAARPLARATGLPARAYGAAGLYDLEVERIFRRDWLCVGRLDQVAEPGAYRCIDLVGEPLVMVRGADDAVRVLSRVCRHRGTDMLSGSGVAERLVCPYHGWTYDLEGALVGAPYMQGAEEFRRDVCRLPALRTEVWQGFVFVNFDDRAPALAPAISGLTERLARYRIADMRVAAGRQFDCEWNWKVTVENFVECYHHFGSHRQTVEPSFPAQGAVSAPFHPVYGLVDIPRAAAAGDPALPPIAGLDAAEQGRLVIVAIYPTHLIVAARAALYWIEVLPAGPTATRLGAYLCLPRETLSRPGIAEVVEQEFAFFMAVNDEDMAISAAVQRGQRSRFARPGPLSSLEEPIWQFIRYLAGRLDAG